MTPEPEDDRRAMHLLHVEDSRGDIALVQEALKAVTLPLQLSTVQDGAQALAFLRRHAPYTEVKLPDVILLDLHLPRVSGYEVLAALQQEPHWQGIPVVVLTSSEAPEDIRQCRELGAKAYLTKPMELQAYLQLVQTTVHFWYACKLRTLTS